MWKYPYICGENGWGFDNFIKEANTGNGNKFPANLKKYMAKVLPAIIVIVYIKGYYDTFKPMGTTTLSIWMSVAVILLGLIFGLAFGKN